MDLGLSIPAEPLFRSPSGLTPSQLYVFMPPNLGGFFMVRSYYPSECPADYFDFERIEALKPAIEACDISTLSQSPMLGFHKQKIVRAVQQECRDRGPSRMPYSVFKKKHHTNNTHM